jgi:DNA-3-methyladenine glycosylase
MVRPMPPRLRPLPRDFYARPALEVAPDLLGQLLVSEADGVRRAGRIVEVEAYVGPEDLACHASKGRTARTEVMFGPPGRAYVFTIYGMYPCFNVVTDREGHPAAVLIRALEPVEGIPLMMRRRAPDGRQIAEHDLCRGPGNLTRALGIGLGQNRLDLVTSTLSIEDRGVRPAAVSWGPRIGIRVAVDRPWRCWITGNRSVSGPRPRA